MLLDVRTNWQTTQSFILTEQRKKNPIHYSEETPVFQNLLKLNHNVLQSVDHIAAYFFFFFSASSNTKF